MQHALILDDNLNNAEVLGELLTVEGFQTIIITHPRDLETALSVADSLRVIFLDLEMPTMNGYQALEFIRSHPDQQNVPVVAYTVHSGEMARARQFGFQAFIGKPVDVERFSADLAEILNGHGVWVLPWAG